MAVATAYVYEWSDPGGSGDANGQDLTNLWVRGQVSEAQSSVYVFQAPNNAITIFRDVLTGDHFTYDAANRLTGGTVASWEQGLGAQGEVTVFKITGLAVPAATFGAWIADGHVAAAPVLFGGDDSITGSRGPDMLWGYDGADTIVGSASAQDGAGDDLRGGDGGDLILGSAAADEIYGNRGDDTLSAAAANDVLHGGQGQDSLNGNAGEDTIFGDLGNDTLRGGQGADSLSGGDGDDWLYGDLGADTMSGGPGADVFEVWSGAGNDRVVDFSPAEGDRIKLDEDDFIVVQEGADMVIDMGPARTVLVGVSSAHWQDWTFQ